VKPSFEIATVALLLTAGCAPLTGTPSLAPRVVEQQRGSVAAATPPAPAPAPNCDRAQAAARDRAALERTQASNARFIAAIAAARTTAARESDRWIDAQSARSVAELAHAETLDQAMLLDGIIADDSDSCGGDDSIAARDMIQALADQQRDQLRRLDR
jgi:hypothetical protein